MKFSRRTIQTTAHLAVSKARSTAILSTGKISPEEVKLLIPQNVQTVSDLNVFNAIIYTIGQAGGLGARKPGDQIEVVAEGKRYTGTVSQFRNCEQRRNHIVDHQNASMFRLPAPSSREKARLASEQALAVCGLASFEEAKAQLVS